jgi:hypothetical protein
VGVRTDIHAMALSANIRLGCKFVTGKITRKSVKNVLYDSSASIIEALVCVQLVI